MLWKNQWLPKHRFSWSFSYFMDKKIITQTSPILIAKPRSQAIACPIHRATSRHHFMTNANNMFNQKGVSLCHDHSQIEPKPLFKWLTHFIHKLSFSIWIFHILLEIRALFHAIKSFNPQPPSTRGLIRDLHALGGCFVGQTNFLHNT